ncbi:MAG TPA: hypothetical protein VJQ82_21735 [Terriglobales bacterium]|nr:hypothetical protein [Terriglobales bacterium]
MMEPVFAQQTPPQDAPQSARNTAQDLTPEQRGRLEKLARLQKNFGKSMNSPGVDLALKEMSRSHGTDRTLVTYELHATGFPANSIFTLYQVQLDGSIIKNLEGVTIDSKGIAICAGKEGTCQGNGPNDPIDLIVFAGKAEPKRFALVSDDDAHLKAFAATVPFPSFTTDKNCKLESVIGTPKGELTFVQGTGFEPNEELIIDSESYGEKHHDITKADGDGYYFSAVMPYVSGKKSGKTVWQVNGKNCHPKLTFTWGTYQLE